MENTAIDEAEKEFIKKRDDKSRDYLSKQYFDLKNLAIILIDFVPYTNKAEMIKGLKELFAIEDNKQPMFNDCPKLDFCDMKEEGILSGGGYYPIGIIYNSDIKWQPIMGIKKKIPEEFLYIEIVLGQFVDFSYFIFYKGVLKKNYQNVGIKDTFVESDDWVKYNEKMANGKETRGLRAKGPRLEQSIRNYKKNLEHFLKPYSHGLFLNTNRVHTRLSCPNLKILSTKKIDFTNFQDWESKHHRFLRHIGFTYFYSQYSKMLVGYYEKHIFRERSIFEGLVFLASESDFKGKHYNGDPEAEIIDKIGFLGWDLFPLLQIMYWSSYTVEVLQPKWEREIENRMSEILSSEDSVELTQEAFDNTTNSYRAFNQHYLREKRNIEALKQNSKRFKRITSLIVELNSRSSSDNLFEDIIDGGNRFLEKEQEILDNIKNEYDLLFKYCNNMITMEFNMINVKLQNSMKWMTIAMLILAILTIIISIIDNYDKIASLWTAFFPKPYG